MWRWLLLLVPAAMWATWPRLPVLDAQASPGAGVADGSVRSVVSVRSVPQAEKPAATLTFNNQVFEHRPADAVTAYLATRSALASNESAVVLVALAEVPTIGKREELKFQGLELSAYVPDRGWVARVRRLEATNQAAARAWATSSLTFFRPFDPSLRIDPRLFEPCDCDAVPFYMYPAPGIDPEQLLEELTTAGFEGLGVFRHGAFPYLAGAMDDVSLRRLADVAGAHPDVQFMTRGAGARLMNIASAKTLQSGSHTGPLPIFAHGVYGSNQVIAVCDTGLDVDHCFFRDGLDTLPPTNRLGGTNVNLSLRKVIAADFLYAGDNPSVSTHWDNDGHGTRVSGHALGSNLSSPLATNANNGMAPGAKLIIQDGGFTVADNCSDLVGLGCPVTNFLPALQQAWAQGARIHNNSWGDNENATLGARNLYSQCSRELDAMTWSNKNFLVVCAAGNDTSNDQVSSPSTAKNGLSVAATVGGSGQDSIASFSSRGWTADGRIKPDLAAPGQSVTSSSSDFNITTLNCGVGAGSGTSFSSPMVAGLAALVRDYFAQGLYASNAMPDVSAALVKAVLINASMNMTNASARPPSRDQGWGRVNLDSALAFTDSVHRIAVADHAPFFVQNPNVPFTTYVNVTSTGQPLKATLVWSDYPGTPGAGKQLINDLDLLVRTKSDNYAGNIFSNGYSLSGVSFDRTNNVEQVHLQVVSTGIVEVSVWAHVIPQPTQDFALVVRGGLDHFPLARDDDADDLPDGWELWHFGSITNAAGADDSDGDGVSNSAEYGANTEPTNALSYLVLEHLEPTASGGIEVAAQLQPGRAFALQAADAEAYVEVSNTAARFITGMPLTPASHTFTDDTASNIAARLYRLLAHP